MHLSRRLEIGSEAEIKQFVGIDMVTNVNRDLINARIREANDALQLLEDITVKDFVELTVQEQL